MIFQFPTQEKKEERRIPLEKTDTKNLIVEYTLTMQVAAGIVLKNSSEQKRNALGNYANKVLLPEIEKRIPLIVEKWRDEKNADWEWLYHYYNYCSIHLMK